jgi:uncharacterized membrane protein YeaQ/YmgE (transglycosylase-associated protein family)
MGASTMSLIMWAVFGAIVGGIARALLPSKLPTGWLPTIAIGCVGSIAGGLPFGTGPAGFVGSIIGAVVVLYLHRMWSESNV